MSLAGLRVCSTELNDIYGAYSNSTLRCWEPLKPSKIKGPTQIIQCSWWGQFHAISTESAANPDQARLPAGNAVTAIRKILVIIRISADATTVYRPHSSALELPASETEQVCV